MRLELVELEAKKSKPRWWTPYWIVLIVLTIITGFALPVFLNAPLEKGILAMILTLLLLCFAYYIRVKPSIRINRILYIVVFGGLFGAIIMFFMAVSGIVRWMTNVVGLNDVTVYILTFVVSFGIGVILGDLFGRYRNYKGPAQYSL